MPLIERIPKSKQQLEEELQDIILDYKVATVLNRKEWIDEALERVRGFINTNKEQLRLLCRR